MNGVKLPFCGTNPLIVLLDSYCMSSYIYNTNMANTKKVKKVYRRTNAQMRRDEARMRREDSQQRSQMNSFLRRKIVDPIHELHTPIMNIRNYFAALLHYGPLIGKTELFNSGLNKLSEEAAALPPSKNTTKPKV